MEVDVAFVQSELSNKVSPGLISAVLHTVIILFPLEE